MTSPASRSSPSPAALALEELRRRARSPEAEPGDIDALLVALQRPVWPGQDVRGRAEVLNRIIEDPFLGGLRGGSGARMDGAAAQALVALGAPYASTLSAKAMEALEHASPVTHLSGEREEQDEEQDQDEESRGEPGLAWARPAAGCLLAVGAYEILWLAPRLEDGLGFFSLLFTVLTLVLPTLTLLSDTRRWVHGLTGVFTLLLLVPSSWLLGLFLFVGRSFMSSGVVALARVALVLTLFIASLGPRRSR